MIALGAWWVTAALGIAGWLLLDASLSGDQPRLQQVGIWFFGFAALASVIGWGASVGSIVRDTGRVRAGAICLLGLPVLGLVMGWTAISSTIANPDDPLAAWWLILSAILLLLGTLLISLPAHLGTQ